MTDLQIDYFMAVARNGSFIQASERLYVSQPAVSRQIASLESELGVVLFDRTKRTIRLTAAGELFYKFFQDYRNGLSTAKYHAKIINEKIEGAFRVGYLEGWSLPDFFPFFLSTLNRQFPAVQISLYAWNLRELAEELEGGSLDIIIHPDLLDPVPLPFSVRQLTEIPLILLYSRDLPQAKLKKPVVEDFRGYSFFSINTFEHIRERLFSRIGPHGIDSKSIVVVPNIETALGRIHAKQGVMVTDSWNREQFNPRIGSFPLEFTQNVVFSWIARDSNKFIQIFMDRLNGFFAGPKPAKPKIHGPGSLLYNSFIMQNFQ
jgi:DNA-binding transcriptional LysR family regulator